MEKNSQSYQLKKIVKQSVIAVIVGAVLLLFSVGTNVWVSIVTDEELETMAYMNQYRLGSKTLTHAVQAYAATGDQQYYDDYMRELNEDKNRDIAWAGLEKNNITKEEWDTFNHIADLSNGLVPIEQQAMDFAKAGDMESAKSNVFGDEYSNTTEQINSITDQVISQVEKRVNTSKIRLRMFQVIIEILYALSFVYVVLEIVRLVR